MPHALIGKPFQLLWSGMALETPVAGSNVLIQKQPHHTNNGRNVWMQKQEGGRIYLLDEHEKPTRYCLDVNPPYLSAGTPGFPTADGCLVFLNEDIPHRQTQLWVISEKPEDGGHSLENVGIDLCFRQGPHLGPYQLDSTGIADPGSSCHIWQKASGGNHNQVWTLYEPVP